MADNENKDKALQKVKETSFSGLSKKVKDALSLESEAHESGGVMTNSRIDRFLHDNNKVDNITRRHFGHWTFGFDRIPTLIMTDDRPGIDRMRIMSKVSDDPQPYEEVASYKRLLYSAT